MAETMQTRKAANLEPFERELSSLSILADKMKNMSNSAGKTGFEIDLNHDFAHVCTGTRLSLSMGEVEMALEHLRKNMSHIEELEAGDPNYTDRLFMISGAKPSQALQALKTKIEQYVCAPG